MSYRATMINGTPTVVGDGEGVDPMPTCPSFLSLDEAQAHADWLNGTGAPVLFTFNRIMRGFGL